MHQTLRGPDLITILYTKAKKKRKNSINKNELQQIIKSKKNKRKCRGYFDISTHSPIIIMLFNKPFGITTDCCYVSLGKVHLSLFTILLINCT